MTRRRVPPAAASSRAAARAPPPTGRLATLAGRLQHVSLRTKVVVPLVALSVLPVVGVGWLSIRTMRETLRERVVQRIEFETSSKARTLQTFLQSLHRDLRVMSGIPGVQAFARAVRAGRPAEIARQRDLAARELATFSRGRRGYAQIRYLNGEAHELLRLEMREGSPISVPPERLATGPDRHYEQVAFSLAPGQIYLSELGVGRPAGRPEESSKRVLSCATPVVWGSDDGRGLLILNVDPRYMFSLVGELPPGAEAWLVNDQGIYLGYMGAAPEKRPLYSMSAMRHLSEDFALAEVERIQTGSTAGSTFRSGKRLISFAPVAFDADAVGKVWSLLIAQPIAPVLAPVERLTVLWWIVIGTVAVLAAVTGFLVANYVIRPLTELRRATLAIAGGDLSQRVSVSTRDEIQDLASNFNAMADRLGAAHERLESWNARLREEVAQQTERLRRLQTGLARADKLASVGQMAASIMHEIGNPLAALKAKIQVAEERGELDPQCETLLPELLSEVDRLGAVLRSFSRLGRLGQGTHRDLDLAEVVRSVVTLVSPQLSRLGVALEVLAPEDLPGIRGDPDQIRQLLINFLLNAAEACPAGRTVELRVRAGDRDDGSPQTVVIEVEDQGVGIPTEDMARIWDPLFTTKVDGTGLGLAICRKIVEDHGGRVEVASEPGRGTLVTVAFPARAEEDPASPPTAG
ncbi:MAG: ATP-binding protein [Gemmatimonadota bacterium]